MILILSHAFGPSLICDLFRRLHHFKIKGQRCSLYCKSFFHKTYSQGGCALSGWWCQQFGDEGTVLLQAFEVNGLVVSGAVLPHAPEHFQPAFAQTAQCAGMTVPTFTFG